MKRVDFHEALAPCFSLDHSRDLSRKWTRNRGETKHATEQVAEAYVVRFRPIPASPGPSGPLGDDRGRE